VSQFCGFQRQKLAAAMPYCSLDPKEESWTQRKSLDPKALEWAARGGGGVTDTGGVQGKFGRCVEGHGLVRTIGDGWMVGLGDPVCLFQPW